MTAALFPLLAAVSAGLASPTPVPAPDIRGPVTIQPFYLAGGWWWLAVGGVLWVMLMVALWFLSRRPKAVTGHTYTPRQIAAQRLQELEAQMDSLDARAFGNAVADVLRVFIGAQYGLHPERQTSEEFLASITGSRTFSVTEHSLLREFLAGCDLLKFARADATLDGKRRLLVQALEFLESSTPTPVPTGQAALTPAA